MSNIDSEIERMNKIDRLAQDVLFLSRNTLLVNLRFLDMALSQFTFIPYSDAHPISTDGKYLAYNDIEWLKKYKKEKEETTRCYLHTVLHCVFRHMYIHSLVNQEYWNLACDIAVEAMINELDIKSVQTRKSQNQGSVINMIKKETKFLTAEKIYNYLISNNVEETKIRQWTDLFREDDHDIWYLPPQQKLALGISPFGESGNNKGNQDDRSNDDGNGDYGELNNEDNDGSPFDQEQQWKEISERMQQDLETFSKQRSEKAGNLIQNLAALNREKYDYESFLKKFAVLGEKMQINDDEFDYVFYTYGLSLYKNMPLIEPLEYKDVKAIKEFVIAIDTSGSVYGPQVQSFLNKTYNIMKSTESFFSKINIHIIQCDTVIQEDAKITNQDEFNEYIKTMQLKGFGGTDFRPVFSYVDEMVKNHEFTNLKGLIYFTDGYGLFPERKPNYETAFVFVRDYYEIPKVPSWAIKLVLEPEEL